MNSLSPTQMTILVTGISLAVGIYVLVKAVQFFRRRSAAQGETRAEKRLARSAEPEKSVAAATGTASQERTREKSARRDEPQLSANRITRTAAFWPAERKVEADPDSITRDDEEHPYVGGSDYQFGPITATLAAMLPVSEDGRRGLTRALRNAGRYEPHAWQNFAASRYLWMMAPLLIFGGLLVIVPESLETMMLVGLVAGPIVGWALPALIVRGRAAERLREIENGLPDMLDLLNMCVSQGMTVSPALGRVSRELRPVYPALSQELQIVTEQSRVGSLEQALTRFSARVDVPEVHSFTSLMIQTERMGTSLSDSLSDYSDSMRESLKQRADEKANAATFKLLFPTVLCLMPAVFLFLMGPALIELNSFFNNGGIQGLDQGASAIIAEQE